MASFSFWSKMFCHVVSEYSVFKILWIFWWNCLMKLLLFALIWCIKNAVLMGHPVVKSPDSLRESIVRRRCFTWISVAAIQHYGGPILEQSGGRGSVDCSSERWVMIGCSSSVERLARISISNSSTSTALDRRLNLISRDRQTGIAPRQTELRRTTLHWPP